MNVTAPDYVQSAPGPHHAYQHGTIKEGRTMREEEARYLAVQLAKQHPRIDAMLVSARLLGRSWADTLTILQEEIASWPRAATDPNP